MTARKADSVKLADRHRQASAEYFAASTGYEMAAMSGNDDELRAADQRLAEANTAYGESLRTLVAERRRVRQHLPSFEDMLTHPWTQPDPTFVVYKDVLPQSAGAPILPTRPTE